MARPGVALLVNLQLAQRGVPSIMLNWPAVDYSWFGPRGEGV
jgi:hypothetical protein